jgi:hypothetical protein
MPDFDLRLNIEAAIAWDGAKFEQLIETVNVYLIPFRISLMPENMGIMMAGLIVFLLS